MIIDQNACKIKNIKGEIVAICYTDSVTKEPIKINLEKEGVSCQKEKVSKSQYLQ